LRDNPRVLSSEEEIVGREDEVAALTDLVEQVERDPRHVLLVGEPGIGKTILWRHAVGCAQAAGVVVLAATPSEPETPLAFSGLRDLIDGVYDDVAVGLPPPQRRALDVALLRFRSRGRPARPGCGRRRVTSFTPKRRLAEFEAIETFIGSKGTFRVALRGTTGPLTSSVHVARGRWRVFDGTGAYADLEGRGRFTAATDQATGALTAINTGEAED
jgi:AAA ATPase domain